jgi:hypothetical protein
LRLGKHHNVYLQRAYAVYGPEVWVEELERFDDVIAMRYGEQKWMAFYHSDDSNYGYNLVPEVVKFGTCGYQYTQAQRTAMSQKNKERMQDSKARQKVASGVARVWRYQPEVYLQNRVAAKEYDLYDPEGCRVHICDLGRFCRERGLVYEKMYKVASGVRIEYEGWKLYPDRKNKVKKPYALISPWGERFEGVGLRAFALKMGLHPRTIALVVQKRVKTHKGWRCADVSADCALAHKGRDYTLIGPSGEEIRINNLTAYCRKHGLSYDIIRHGGLSRGWKRKE